MSLIKDLITAIRYYNSLDPYHRDVDNRPLNDLGSNQGVMADGLDTGLLSQKVVSAAAGFVARGLLGENMAVGKTEISGWTFKVKRLLAVMNKVASGTDYRLVPELSLWSEQLAPSGAGEGVFTFGQHADKYNIYSIRVTTGQALTTKTPFYDATLSTYFPQVCEVQQASFVLVSSQVSSPPGPLAWSALGLVASDQLEILRIVVPPATLGVATAVTSSMVTHMSYQEEGSFSTASSGGGTGDFLTLPRAKQYGLSNASDSNADNLVLVNPLTETDLDLVVLAGAYGVAAALVPDLTNSPASVPPHTAQIGTWGAGVLEVVRVDAYVLQTLTLTRSMPGLGVETYLAREVWVRESTDLTWAPWALAAVTGGGVVEMHNATIGVYEPSTLKEVPSKEYSLPRPAGRKVRVLMVGAGAGGTGGGQADEGGNGYSNSAGQGGSNACLLELEIEFNRDVTPDSALEFTVPRRSYGGAEQSRGENGGSTVLKIGDHEIVVPGGYSTPYYTWDLHHASTEPWATYHANISYPMLWYAQDGILYPPFAVRYPYIKLFSSHPGYLPGASAKDRQQRPHKTALATGDVFDFWDTEGVRVRVIRSTYRTKCIIPAAEVSVGVSEVDVAYITDGTRGNALCVSVNACPRSSPEAFPIDRKTNRTATEIVLATDPGYEVGGPGTGSDWWWSGEAVNRDTAKANGQQEAPRGGKGNVAYAATPLPGDFGNAWGCIWGEHALDTSWGYGGGGGGSGTRSNTSGRHYYEDPWEAGLDGTGYPRTGDPVGDLQRAGPGGRGGPGYVRFQPL